MKNNLIALHGKEATEINGGGGLYDLYKIIVEEADDFVEGFKYGLKNGIF
jgi:hypothetical protein